MTRQEQAAKMRPLVTKAENGCWKWLGFVDFRGYPKYRDPITKQSVIASRHLYKIIMGEVPAANLTHKCGNRICVNPDHITTCSEWNTGRSRKKKGKDARA